MRRGAPLGQPRKPLHSVASVGKLPCDGSLWRWRLLAWRALGCVRMALRERAGCAAPARRRSAARPARGCGKRRERCSFRRLLRAPSSRRRRQSRRQTLVRFGLVPSLRAERLGKRQNYSSTLHAAAQRSPSPLASTASTPCRPCATALGPCEPTTGAAPCLRSRRGKHSQSAWQRSRPTRSHAIPPRRRALGWTVAVCAAPAAALAQLGYPSQWIGGLAVCKISRATQRVRRAAAGCPGARFTQLCTACQACGRSGRCV